MLDKNGIEMKTGDIVRVLGAYFKNDNGLYFVEHSPGDPSWCGKDHCLHKLCKSGKISTAKYNLAFWPLKSYTNDRWKRAESNIHNESHATIEILHGINTDYIKNFFEEKAQNFREEEKEYRWRFGEDCQTTIKSKECAEFYETLAKNIGTH